jgi:hypothetical protein
LPKYLQPEKWDKVPKQPIFLGKKLTVDAEKGAQSVYVSPWAARELSGSHCWF